MHYLNIMRNFQPVFMVILLTQMKRRKR